MMRNYLFPCSGNNYPSFSSLMYWWDVPIASFLSSSFFFPTLKGEKVIKERERERENLTNKGNIFVIIIIIIIIIIILSLCFIHFLSFLPFFILSRISDNAIGKHLSVKIQREK
uniref:Uncharacterized protein n=1 Tax=Trypanosoma vivax (strain Y486) TaxID=1055687 RepID=G0UD24_TRYVY|nr:hypothetical protein, unlikely [Trypanosoma vivax Y486]